MTYPGNPALSADAQQRLLGTFDQTLALAESGSRQEALLGCDFVLRMDPQFEPARRLQDRLKSSAGPVAIADLKAPAAAPPPPAAPFPPSHAAPAPGDVDFGDIHDLSHLAAELPELDDLGDELPELPAVAAGPAHDAELRARLADLLAARRFPQLLAIVERESAAVLADPELGHLAEVAHQRMEAEPYVHKFLDKVRQALANGDAAEAGRLLEKARSLDPTHPEIAELAARSAATAAPAPPASPAAAVPLPAPHAGASIALGAPASSPSQQQAAIEPESVGFSLSERELPEALRPGVSAGAAFGGDSESERRIRQLLDEGDAALAGGDPQAAIDAWSRIFLIDIDHQEAARRIEGARKVKAENERQVEEIFHDGLARLEAGDLPAARQAFERVVALQPSYLAAREFLQQLDAGEVPIVAPAPTRDLGPATGEGPAALPLPHLDAVPGDLKEEILVPPEPGASAPRGERRDRRERKDAAEATAEGPAAGRKKRASRTFVYVGSAVLLLVLLVAGAAYWKRDELFPNSRDETLTAAPKPNPITKATNLHKQGKDAIAVAQLKRLPPADPHYQEAQKLIAAWSAPAAPVVAVPPPLAAGVSAHRAQLLADARQASAAHDDLTAVEKFDEAGKLAKLEGADADDMARAQHELEPFATELNAFRQHEWEYVLPALWRLREKNPGNRDLDRLIVDSYYDLGVRDLQRADPTQALSRFQEALKIDPNDADLKRNSLFAQTYQERPQDMLFRIYVKYLPIR